MDLFQESLKDILKMSASGNPTPGGGSISAVAGALGVSMAAMVGNLTIGKPKYSEVEDEVKEITRRCYEIISCLEEKVADDIKAFSSFMESYRMPAGSEEEKEKRRWAIQKSLKEATRVPLETAKMLVVALTLAERVAALGNKMAVSDAGVAAYLCEAAVNSTLLNVDINLPMIEDEEFREKVEVERRGLAAEAKRIKEASLENVFRRIK